MGYSVGIPLAVAEIFIIAVDARLHGLAALPRASGEDTPTRFGFKPCLLFSATNAGREVLRMAHWEVLFSPKREDCPRNL